jgi:hypothetical protein
MAEENDSGKGFFSSIGERRSAAVGAIVGFITAYTGNTMLISIMAGAILSEQVSSGETNMPTEKIHRNPLYALVGVSVGAIGGLAYKTLA